MDNSMSSPSDLKSTIMRKVREEAAVSNARTLIEKMNENCFEKCIPTPGSSISKGEEACFKNCIQKYIEGWNTVNRTYINRIQQEQQRSSTQGGVF